MALAARQEVEDLEEKLREAARDGRTEEVISLLDVGVSVDATIEHGWTPLMWAAMYGHVGCINLLLDRGAQPNLQDKDGRTPLMCASSTGRIDCMKVLLDRGAQATLQDKDGWTALRYASSRDHAECMKVLLDRGAMASCENVELIQAIEHGRMEEVKKLIEVNNINKDMTPGEKLHDAAQCGRTEEVYEMLEKDGVEIDTMNEVGESPLILAAGFGRVDCVNLLLSRGAKANHQDKIGHTALHWASLYSHVGSVRALLATPGINVNIQGFDGLIPLKVATKYEIIAMLKKYTTNCEDYPIHSFGKVILCGDTGSGKTTLAQAIEYYSKSRFGKGKPHDVIHPGPVKLLTAGIVPHLIKNEEMNMMLFDLAGHHTYYSSHCAVLEAISLSPSTFLILVNLLLDFEDINKQLYYWSGMIGDVCHRCPQQSSVIVVGTHSDGITDREQLESLCAALKKAARNAIKKHTFTDFAALNATAFNGEEMEKFASLLCKTNNSVIANYPAISLNTHMMYAFLNDKVHQNEILLSQLLTLLREEEPKFLPTESTEVSPLLKTLSIKGLIVFFNDTMAENSWIVIHPEVLLEKVNGVLFAPSSFVEYLPIASNTGVIPVVLLKEYFPAPTYNADMIIQFLQLFELCVQITLNNVDTNMAPELPPNALSTDNIGSLLFFPACIRVDRPAKVIIPSCVFVWQICTASISQFFSPRCLHVLISRLADHFALLGVKPSSIPELDRYNRRCSVWCKGIHWMTENAVMIVVEMKDDFRCLSCTIDTSDRSSPKYLLSVITFVKEVCNEFCPSVPLVELISCPPEATSDNMPTTVELSLLKEVAKTKANKLIDSTGEKQVMISKWKKVEPQLFDLIGVDKNKNEADTCVPAKRPRLDSNEDCSEPRLADLLNDIASTIPAKWRDIGINLGLSSGILDNIQNQNAGKTDASIRSFEQIFSMWKEQSPRPYTWKTIIDVLKTSTVNENDLATRMASKYIIEN